MPERITQDKLDEMFKAFQEKQVDEYVAEICKVSVNTVKKYRRAEKWIPRIQRINQRAIEKADNEAVSDRAKQLIIVKGALKSYAAQLFRKVMVDCPHCGKSHEVKLPNLKAKFGDIKKLIESVALIEGDPTERKHITVKIEHVMPDDKPKGIE